MDDMDEFIREGLNTLEENMKIVQEKLLDKNSSILSDKAAYDLFTLLESAQKKLNDPQVDLKTKVFA